MGMKEVIKYIRLPFIFSVERLGKELNALSAQWVAHFNKAHYDGEWSALPLRSINGQMENIIPEYNSTGAFKDTILMEQCPYIKSILGQFDSELKAVRLLKLSPGAVIKEHTDLELCYEQGEARIHIPITTNDLVEFYLDNERIYMKPGECWYMNFNLPHRIINGGSTDRVHLVIDIVVNDKIRKMFEAVDAEMKKMTRTKEEFSSKDKMNIVRQLRELNTPASNKLAEEMEAALKIDE